MRASLLTPTLASLIKLGRTVCIESSPGTGKTSIVRQVASDLGYQYIEHHLPTMLVEDFGIPMINSTTLRYLLPDWYPAKGSRWDNGVGGVLCFDDRNQAGTDLQKVLANISQARTLHGVDMAPGWTVVSTGNRMADRAGANRVLSHLRNRETVLEMTVDVDDWCLWAQRAGIPDVVIGFIRFRTNLLNAFDPQQDLNPTPRSWAEGVAPVIGNVPTDAEYDVVKGAVGEGAAVEFMAYCKVYRQLPSIDNCLINPDTAPLPTELSARYAVAVGIATRVTDRNVQNAVRYLRRMPQDFMVMAVKQFLRSDAVLASTPAVTQLFAEFGSAFR